MTNALDSYDSAVANSRRINDWTCLKPDKISRTRSHFKLDDASVVLTSCPMKSSQNRAS